MWSMCVCVCVCVCVCERERDREREMLLNVAQVSKFYFEAVYLQILALQRLLHAIPLTNLT